MSPVPLRLKFQLANENFFRIFFGGMKMRYKRVFKGNMPEISDRLTKRIKTKLESGQEVSIPCPKCGEINARANSCGSF